MANTKINTHRRGKKKPIVQNTDPPLSLADSSEHYTSNDDLLDSNDETNTPTPSPRKAWKVLKTKKRQFSEEADIPPEIQSLWPDTP